MKDQQGTARDYDALPPVLKHKYTREQYAWLSDDQKDSLQHENCNPPDDVVEP